MEETATVENVSNKVIKTPETPELTNLAEIETTVTETPIISLEPQFVIGHVDLEPIVNQEYYGGHTYVETFSSECCCCWR